MAWLLVSVQFMELVWVLLNLVGVERTTTSAAVRSVPDIQLALKLAADRPSAQRGPVAPRGRCALC